MRPSSTSSPPTDEDADEPVCEVCGGDEDAHPANEEGTTWDDAVDAWRDELGEISEPYDCPI